MLSALGAVFLRALRAVVLVLVMSNPFSVDTLSGASLPSDKQVMARLATHCHGLTAKRTE
jgi:hypothetical protein